MYEFSVNITQLVVNNMASDFDYSLYPTCESFQNDHRKDMSLYLGDDENSHKTHTKTCSLAIDNPSLKKQSSSYEMKPVTTKDFRFEPDNFI